MAILFINFLQNGTPVVGLKIGEKALYVLRDGFIFLKTAVTAIPNYARGNKFTSLRCHDSPLILFLFGL
jgi:hypothetical protein